MEVEQNQNQQNQQQTFLNTIISDKSFRDADHQTILLQFIHKESEIFEQAIQTYLMYKTSKPVKKSIPSIKTHKNVNNYRLDLKQMIKDRKNTQKLERQQGVQDYQRPTVVKQITIKCLKDHIPPQTQYYQTVQRNFIVMRYKSVIATLGPDQIPGYNIQDINNTFLTEEMAQIEKSAKQIDCQNKKEIVYEHEMYRFKFLALRVMQEFGASITNMQILGLVLQKDVQQLAIKVWFPVLQNNFGKQIEQSYQLSADKIYKIKPYKFIQTFCQFCLKFNCLVHFVKDDWLNQEEQEQATDYNQGHYNGDKGAISKKVGGELLTRGVNFNRKLKSKKNEQQQHQINWGNQYRCKEEYFDRCCGRNADLYENVFKQVDGIEKPLSYFKKHFQKYQVEYVKFAVKYQIGSDCFVSYAFDNTLNCQQVCLIKNLLLKHNNQMDEEQEMIHQRNNKNIVNNQQQSTQEPRDKIQQTYQPCQHEGPCTKDNDKCQCAFFRGKCEKYCMCSTSCSLRFQGCQCKDACEIDHSNQNSQSKKNNRNINQKACPCHVAGRECDPDLCSCHSHYNKRTILKNKLKLPYCKNTDILYKVKPRLILQKSNICDGLCVVAGQEFQAGEFIGEYVGEMLTKDESLFKDEVYIKNDIHYFFDLGYDQQTLIDPYPYGSKVRFLNYMSGEELENCEVKYVFVKGMTRIALYSTKLIHPGQELFFNYGQSYNVKWKKAFDTDCQQWEVSQEDKKKNRYMERKKQNDIEKSTKGINKSNNLIQEFSNMGINKNNNNSSNKFTRNQQNKDNNTLEQDIENLKKVQEEIQKHKLYSQKQLAQVQQRKKKFQIDSDSEQDDEKELQQQQQSENKNKEDAMEEEEGVQQQNQNKSADDSGSDIIFL